MATPKFLLMMTVLGSSLAVSAPALAGDRTAEVRTSDLDLARPSAQATLQQRISRAVKNVCRSDNVRDISARAEAQRCEARAMADAEKQIVTRIAEHKSRRSQAALDRLKLASD